MVFLCYCTLDHVTRKKHHVLQGIVVEIKPSKNLIEASHLLSFVVWSQERYSMDAIWIPIQPAWGVERNPGGPKANNSIPSKLCT